MITGKEILDMTIHAETRMGYMASHHFKPDEMVWRIPDGYYEKTYVSDENWRKAFSTEPDWAPLMYQMVYSGMGWPDETAEMMAEKLNTLGSEGFMKYAADYLSTAKYRECYPLIAMSDGEVSDCGFPIN